MSEVFINAFQTDWSVDFIYTPNLEYGCRFGMKISKVLDMDCIIVQYKSEKLPGDIWQYQINIYVYTAKTFVKWLKEDRTKAQQVIIKNALSLHWDELNK